MRPKRMPPVSTESDGEVASEAWALLRAGGRESTGLEIPTFPTGVKTPAGAARLALGERGEPRLLLPLEPGDKVASFSEAPSLRILVSSYLTDGKAQRYLDLTCMVTELEAVFSEVTTEILARLESGQGCVSAAQSTIQDFRRLLRSSGVPTTRIVGLVGELLVLNRLLEEASAAWRTWRGPMGDRHDFRSGDHALEVKTSSRASASTITVNSIEQMSPPSGGSLYLLHILLEEAAAGQISIASLGRAVLNRADEPDRIRDRLAALGCDDVDSPQWNTVAFRLEAQTYYLVDDLFPRLTPNMLPEGVVPAGVSGVTYQVDLATATQSRCNEAEAYSLEKTLITCLSPD